MPRDVDPRRTRKALRRVQKLAQAQGDAAYSAWEQEFLQEVETRLQTYGSAFADLSKGAAEDALSRLQAQKLKEIAKKAKDEARAGPEGEQQRPQKRGLRPGKGFKRRPMNGDP